MKFQQLLKPGKIGSLTLKNRFVMAPMGSNFAEENGTAGERLRSYYIERAKGGVGLIIMETSATTWPKGASMPNMLGFSSEDFLPDLTLLTEEIHKYDCKVAAQLNHSGKISQEDVAAGRSIPVPSIPKGSKSDMFGLLTMEELANFVKAAGPDGKGPRYHIMTQEEIRQEIKNFGLAARIAQRAGFDAIELHAGHGYLISSFLSPAVNNREDEYGGSAQNRARFLSEVIKEVKHVTSNELPIIVRLDAKEYRVDGGISEADFLITIKIAEESGADAIDVSSYGNPAKGIAFTEAPLVHEPGGFIKFAKKAKAEVQIPILAVGRIDIETANEGIGQNDFDFVVMGRKLLADPELPNKVATNSTDLIRPCIYCYICVSKIFINQPMCCAVNADMGNEHWQKNIIATDRVKHYLIIGAGPGGMESARRLALAGNKVTVWEKSKQLGGTVNIAALAYEPNQHLINYFRNNLLNLGVHVETNKTATIEDIKKLNPDHVILATGAIRNAPPIKGKDQHHVFDGEELRGMLFGLSPKNKGINPLVKLVLNFGRSLGLLGNVNLLRLFSKFWMPLKKEIVIIGGDLVGLELGEFLQERGRHITILEPTENLGKNLSIVRRSRVVHLLKEHGAAIHRNCADIEIHDGSVTFKNKEEEISIKASQVIIAIGTESNNALTEELSSTNIPFTRIGDAEKAGYIHGAIWSARDTVNELMKH
jgi:2,4-dienoyl-CoA reductase-like NADH-dependent reductase (Old Yellow Enzyme family)/NADPH-dependent 2,4-dienoyl-CoA reductase/sulfur reductase-like enzyme